jgi:hypothetical protein
MHVFKDTKGLSDAVKRVPYKHDVVHYINGEHLAKYICIDKAAGHTQLQGIYFQFEKRPPSQISAFPQSSFTIESSVVSSKGSDYNQQVVSV